MLSIVAQAVALVLTGLAMFGPMWFAGLSGTAFGMPIEGRAEFGPLATATIVTSPSGTSVTPAGYDAFPSIGSVMRWAALLIGASLALDVFVLWRARGLSADHTKRFSEFAARLAGPLAAFLAASVMYVTLPGAATEDSARIAAMGGFGLAFPTFAGSNALQSPGLAVTVNWGGGWGWYALLIGALMLTLDSYADLRGARAPVQRRGMPSPSGKNRGRTPAERAPPTN